MIGLNFGGWVIGLVTGVIGAGLSFAWIPDKRKPVPATGLTVNAYGSAAPTHGAHDDAGTIRTDRPIGAHAVPRQRRRHRPECRPAGRAPSLTHRWHQTWSVWIRRLCHRCRCIETG